jgi:hypothetical protein
MLTIFKKIKDYFWTVESKAWPNIYLVKWIDPTSNFQETWLTPEQLKKLKPLVCMAAGFLVEKTPEYVKMSCTVCANGYSGQVIVIPLGHITYIQKVAGV